MATKVIKLQDNNNNILIPVTDASVVQMSVDGQAKSVKDVILEDEEVTAAGFNELDERLDVIEASYVKGLDTTAGTGFVTGATLVTDSAGGKKIKLSYGSATNYTQYLSGEYRAAAKSSYIKLSNSGGEVGLYDAGGKTAPGSNTYIAYVQFSYDTSTKKGIGLKISYADHYDIITRSYTSGIIVFSLKNGGTPTTGSSTGNYYVPVMTASQLGVAKTKADRTSSITATVGGTTSGRYYGVEKDSNNQLFVNVPWKDYDNLLTGVMHMKGGTTVGPSSTTAYSNGDTYIYNATTTYTIPAGLSYNGVAQIVTKGDMFTYAYGKWTVLENNNEVATSDTLGLVKSVTTGTTANRNYNVEVNSDGTMKVNVPWDTNTDHYDKIEKSYTGTNGLKLFKVTTVGSATGSTTGDYYLPVATTSGLGTVKPGTTSGQNYGVSVAADGAMTVNVPWSDNSTTLSGHYTPTAGTNTTPSGSVNIGGKFTEVSYLFDSKGHKTAQITKEWTINAPSTLGVYKSVSLSNNTPTKYVEVASNVTDIDSTFLSSIGSGTTSYYTSSCTTTALGVSGDKCTAYIKSTTA